MSRTQRAKRWSGSSRRGSSVSVWPHAFFPSLGSDWRPCLLFAVPNVRLTPAPTTPVLHDVFTIVLCYFQRGGTPTKSKHAQQSERRRLGCWQPGGHGYSLTTGRTKLCGRFCLTWTIW